jgi:hypothetical protein
MSARLRGWVVRNPHGIVACGIALADRARAAHSLGRFPMCRWLLSLSALVLAAPVWAGPYATPGISAGDPAIVGWATAATLVRGPQSIANPAGPLASYGVAGNALGPADGTLGVVSLGDGGHITLTFGGKIYDGPGADFAVFENGFAFQGGLFTELAFVEVSSDGVNFVRFPASSLTPTATQAGAFDPLDPINLHNPAGKHPALEGTPFDLAELAGKPLLDVNAVTHVRLVDVVGAIDPAYATYDKDGNPVNDPWPTDFEGSGFDLDAVGVIHQTPEPTALLLGLLGMVGGYCARRKLA